MKDIFVYDIEIINAIPPKNGQREPGINYCEGWKDHFNMGIACICGYSFQEDRYRVFTQGNFEEFIDIVLSGTIMAGFNNIPFDNSVIAATLDLLIGQNQCYDLLREVWIAAGLSPEFQYPSHAGYGLDALATANGFPGKTGNGAIAPIDWQRGYYGKVIDYCLQNVKITTKLIQRAISFVPMTDPKTGLQINPRTPTNIY